MNLPSTMKWSIGLGAGAIAGLVGAVAAEMTAGLIGWSFSEVTPLTIGVAALLPNLAGGVFYSQVAARTPQPWLIYSGVAVLMGVVYTLLVGVQPPHPDFMLLIVPLHAVVTIVSVLTLPLAARGLATWTSQPFSRSP
jgi:hypothetical protein